MDASLFHSLEGESIGFKILDTADTTAIHSYTSDPEVKRFIGWPLMLSEEQTREHIEEMLRREAAGTHLYASVAVKATGEVIGTAMLFNFDREAKNAEIGYVFHRASWGKGYGTETVRLVCGFAFDALELHRLHARVASANAGSARVLEKNGFAREGCLREHYRIEGKYYDSLLYGRLKA